MLAQDQREDYPQMVALNSKIERAAAIHRRADKVIQNVKNDYAKLSEDYFSSQLQSQKVSTDLTKGGDYTFCERQTASEVLTSC